MIVISWSSKWFSSSVKFKKKLKFKKIYNSYLMERILGSENGSIYCAITIVF